MHDRIMRTWQTPSHMLRICQTTVAPMHASLEMEMEVELEVEVEVELEREKEVEMEKYTPTHSCSS